MPAADATIFYVVIMLFNLGRGFLVLIIHLDPKSPFH